MRGEKGPAERAGNFHLLNSGLRWAVRRKVFESSASRTSEGRSLWFGSRLPLGEEFFQGYGLSGIDLSVPGFKQRHAGATLGKIGLDLLVPSSGVLFIEPCRERGPLSVRKFANRLFDDFRCHSLS